MTHSAHFDYASSAPLLDEVRQEMIKFIETDSYDPRRLYDPAIVSRYAIEESRQKVAEFIGAQPSEVIFTSSASESLATFAYGVIPRKEQSFREDINFNEHYNVIYTPYDSKVVRETWLRENINTRVISATTDGRLNIENLADFVDENTLALCVPFAHPDTGTLQEVQKIIEIVKSKNEKCLVHVDARIAAGNSQINFKTLGCDAITIDPSIFGGPFGVAALIVKAGTRLTPLLEGSTQERTRRAGTENMIGIAGFGKACEINSNDVSSNIEKYEKFRSTIETALEKFGAKVIAPDSPSLSNIVCAYFEGTAASVIVQQLNSKGLNIHAGSSCGSEEFEPSLELVSVVEDENIAESAFRISWGHATTREDVQLLIDALASL